MYISPQIEVHCVGSNLCVVCGNGLYLYPVTTSAATLSAAIGKYTQTTTSDTQVR